MAAGGARIVSARLLGVSIVVDAVSLLSKEKISVPAGSVYAPLSRCK